MYCVVPLREMVGIWGRVVAATPEAEKIYGGSLELLRVIAQVNSVDGKYHYVLHDTGMLWRLEAIYHRQYDMIETNRFKGIRYG